MEVELLKMHKPEEVDMAEEEEKQHLWVTYWTSKSRPEGFVGPTGVYNSPMEGDVSKMYMRVSEEDVFSVIEPNGFHEPDPTPAEKVIPEVFPTYRPTIE